MRGLRVLILMLIVTILVGGCGSSAKISVAVRKPAALDLPGVKEIAVVDFKGVNRSGSQVATMLQSMLLKSQHFDIMEREKISSVLDEQNMGMAGIIDESTASEVGALLGVDAMVFGDVATYKVEADQIFKRKVKEKRRTGKYRTVNKKDKKTGKVKKVKEEIIEEVFIERDYYVRKGTVGINFRIVSVKSGKLLAAHSESKSYNSQDEKRGLFASQYIEDPSKLKPEGEILNDLSTDICKKFVRMIAPYTVNESRVIESGKGAIDSGRKFAQSGLWPEAQDAWEGAAVSMPNEPAVFYNLGLAYEVQGMLDRAEASYKKAITLKQKDLYLKALARVRKAKNDRIKLLKQQNDR
ncbi:hypothetical protein KAR48_00685 [bacterium]|nr:hypothetical protein [bacterium]